MTDDHLPENLCLRPVLSPKDTDLPFLLKLYTETFPREERREKDALKKLLGKAPMHFMAISKGEQRCGFIIYWDFEDFRFVEHFALFPAFRGQQLGAQVLKHISIPGTLPAKTPKTLLLEVEPLANDVEPAADIETANETSRRRISFYERNGFQVLDLPYFQPPYHPNQPPMPMLLMSNKAQWEKTELQAAIGTIHQRVYKLKG